MKEIAFCLIKFNTVGHYYRVFKKVVIENNNNLSVLDFGGSLRSTYYQNKTFLENLNSIEWSIVEQTHFLYLVEKIFLKITP